VVNLLIKLVVIVVGAVNMWKSPFNSVRQ